MDVGVEGGPGDLARCLSLPDEWTGISSERIVFVDVGGGLRSAKAFPILPGRVVL